MSPWSSFYRRLAGPVEVEHTVPPQDVIPPRRPVLDPAEAEAIEHASRVREALRLVEVALARESQRARRTGLRNADLANLGLDLRSVLHPAPIDAEVLREVPAAPLRYAEGGLVRSPGYRWYAS